MRTTSFHGQPSGCRVVRCPPRFAAAASSATARAHVTPDRRRHISLLRSRPGADFESRVWPNAEKQNMKQGALSDYFTGVGTKTLRGTEVDPSVSHGHELQGVDDFRAFLGTPSEKTRIPV